MRFDQGKFETYHLTCMVCGVLPGTTCLDEDYRELPQVHPSRRMSIGERNWRFRQGWEPPELVERRRKRQAEEKGPGCSVQSATWPGGEAGAEGPAESRPGRLVTDGPGLPNPGGIPHTTGGVAGLTTCYVPCSTSNVRGTTLGEREAGR